MGVRLERGPVHGWDGWWIRHDALALGLVPSVGGRLMSMRWRDDELSFVHPAHAGRSIEVSAVTDVAAFKRETGFVHWGGDKTWLAPQERWAEAVPFLDLDGGVYALEVERADAEEVRVTMTSPVCREVGARLSRTVAVRAGRTEWTMVHALENLASDPITWGLWDVHQVNGPGIAYVPRRRDSVFRGGVKAFAVEGDSEGVRGSVLREMGTIVAIDCRVPRWFKFGVDAQEGWALGVIETPSGGLVGYLKAVPAVPGAIYAHGCVVEVYNSPDHRYFELEAHGPVVTLAPRERVTLVERRRVFDVARWPDRAEEVEQLCGLETGA